MRVVVHCPAKVNLFLSVGPPDQRSYHPIRTIFQAVGLFDELEITDDGDGFELHSNWPLPEENTLTKAHRLASEALSLPPLKVSLTKRIPAEAGLGGGSSDAAGLLRALRFFTPNLPQQEFLMDVAAAVGADVPFFLVGGRALGEGYGERLTGLPDRDKQWLLIAKPDASCSTAEAYARLDQTPRDWRDFPEADELYNDFERVAPCESLELLDRLSAHGARDAALCGSGSAVFGRFGAEDEARYARQQLECEGVAQTWVAPTLTREQSLRYEIG